ncbi:uncharacterized protein LOC123391314 [Mustela putorius furo]|uniref:Uncharacterized protein LOC123391314 n=1 Tax=Mustela putorius furo TaxID=9669 RepID=A0A8U0S2J9_MUSPF|nr:uncharacterized protein LOC123391314 [Mustela putorius furo]
MPAAAARTGGSGPPAATASALPHAGLFARRPRATTADLVPPPLSLGSRRRRRRRGDRRAGRRDGRGGSPGCDARDRGRARPRRPPAPSARAPLGRPPVLCSLGSSPGNEWSTGLRESLVLPTQPARPFTYCFNIRPSLPSIPGISPYPEELCVTPTAPSHLGICLFQTILQPTLWSAFIQACPATPLEVTMATKPTDSRRKRNTQTPPDSSGSLLLAQTSQCIYLLPSDTLCILGVGEWSQPKQQHLPLLCPKVISRPFHSPTYLLEPVGDLTTPACQPL